MLRHIVMMKFKKTENVTKLRNEFKNSLLDLLKSIPELKKMEVGLNINKGITAFDLVLTADFVGEEGLNAYRVHPEHVKILNKMKKVVEKTAAVDYYFE